MSKIKHIKQGKYIYVCTEEPRYRLPNGKLSKIKRTYYGKIEDEEFVPNRTYIMLSKKEKEALGIEETCDENIVEKALRKESNKMDKKNNQILSSRRFYGSVYLLEEATRTSGLAELIHNAFPQDYKKILSLCYFYILERNSALYRFDVWGRIHKHPFNSSISSSSSSKFLSSITENERDYFLSKWARLKGEKEILAIDSTSISSYSQALSMAKRGVNKDHDYLEQINLLVGFGVNNHLPVYIKELPGHISDVSTVENLLADINSYGITAATFFTDRGFYSKNNITAMIEQGYNFLCVVKGHPLYVKNLFNDIVDIEYPQYYIPSQKVYAVTRKYVLQYDIDDVPKGKTVYLTKSYNPEIAMRDKVKFSNKIAKMKEELETKNTVRRKSDYNKFFNVKWEETQEEYLDSKTGNTKTRTVETKNPLSYSYNDEAIAKEMKDIGWVCFISNVYKDSETVVQKYKQRDSVEKFFENLKERIGLDRLLTGKQTVIDSKIFIAFISLIIFSELENKVKLAKSKTNSMIKNYSMQKLFDEFETIEEYSVGRGKPRLSEITKKQHQILSELGLNDLV